MKTMTDKLETLTKNEGFWKCLGSNHIFLTPEGKNLLGFSEEMGDVKSQIHTA